MTRLLSLAALAAFTLCSCTGLGEPEPDRAGTVSITLGSHCGSVTRSSLGTGVEDRFSGAVLGAYLESDGELIYSRQIQSPDESISFSLPSGRYVFKVLCNLFLYTENGEKVFPRLPQRLEDLNDLEYRIGGVPAPGSLTQGLSGRLLTGTLSQIGSAGLPSAGSTGGIFLNGDVSLGIELESLFARICLLVDHSEVNRTADGRTVSDLVVNKALRTRNINRTLRPFRKGSSAVSQDDVMDIGDFEPAMTNGDMEVYTLYVPENVMGRLMPDNEDPSLKNADELGKVSAGSAGLCTYLELMTRVGSPEGDEPNGGYAGDISYRLYPGEDNCSDFSIHRNTDYCIRLTLTVNGFFINSWKSEQEDGFIDDRYFGFTRSDSIDPLDDNAFLGEDDVIAVRKNRAGFCYVWFNDMTGFDIGENSGAKPADWDYKAANMIETRWASDFYSPIPSYFDTPVYYEMLSYGIKPSYDPVTHRLSFTVADPSRFVSGKEFTISAWMIPGFRDRCATAKVRTYDNIEVYERDGLSLQTGFYTGMKRTLQIRGLVSDRVEYSFSRSGAVSETASTTESYVSGRTYIKSAAELGDDLGSEGGIPLYAFSTGGTNRISFSCADDFNDVIPDVSVTSRRPYYSPSESCECPVPIDGTEVAFSADGAWTDLLGKPIARELFDDENYETWLGLESTVSSKGSDDCYTWTENSTVYMKKMTASASASLTVKPRNPSLGTGSCTIRFTPAVPSFETGPGCPVFGDRLFDDLGADAYFASMAFPANVRQSAKLLTRGNSFERARMDILNGDDREDTRKWSYDHNSGLLTWEWGSVTHGPTRIWTPGLVPEGLRRIYLNFTNSHSGETYSIYQDVTDRFRVELGYYVVFYPDEEFAHVYICTGKEYQILDNMTYGTLKDPAELELGVINGHDYGSGLTWNSTVCHGLNTGNHALASSRSYLCSDYVFGGKVWTRDMINHAIRRDMEDGTWRFVDYVKLDGEFNCDRQYGPYMTVHVPNPDGLRMWGYRIVNRR